MPAETVVRRLRQCALAVAVLHDVDLTPADDGVVLPGATDVLVGWAECGRAVAGEDPESAGARQRLADWLVLRRALADHHGDDLAERARPYAVPVLSPRHPGLDWIRKAVPGDALHLGFGFAGLDPRQPDGVIAVPHELLRAAGVRPEAWWAKAVGYLERMGQLAVQRFAREPRPVLRPMGDCDVVTLLGSRALRTMLADQSGGLCPVAVPDRSRGWFDLSRVDPAFAAAAWQLTDPAARAFPRPVLVTRDEVVTARVGSPTAPTAPTLIMSEYARNEPI